MLADITAYLTCPHCGRELAAADGSLQCAARHVFDIARQGYVSLLPGNARTGSADTAAMVHARAELLAAGHFGAVAEALAARGATLVGPDQPSLVVDVGAGTGYYLAAVVEQLPRSVGVALDLSKHAARRAARAHPRIGAVVCDAWQRLPVRTGAAALALGAFAPRNAAELWRVLQPGGAVLVVTPTPQHLHELVEPLGLLTVDPEKDRRLGQQLRDHFLHERDDVVHTVVRLDAADAQRVALMGPSAWHTDADIVARRVATLTEPIEATVSVRLGVYRRRNTPGAVAGSVR